KLERDLGSQLDPSRVAAVDLIPLAEQRITWRKVVGHVGTIHELHVINHSGRVLRMVEGVEEIGAELELGSLPNGETLRNRNVPIIDDGCCERVAASVG